MKDILELVKFIQTQTQDEKEQVAMLAALVDEVPGEDFNPPMQLPVQNDVPGFSLKQPGVGGDLAGLDFGVAAPVFGQKGNKPETLGELLTGEIDGNF